MAQYRKKPVVVEAYQTSEDMDIYTLEGVMHASAGDYIITGISGEQYPSNQRGYGHLYAGRCYARLSGGLHYHGNFR
nr:MAG TPA: PGDYG protein [Caudoviricetes sp.]